MPIIVNFQNGVPLKTQGINKTYVETRNKFNPVVPYPDTEYNPEEVQYAENFTRIYTEYVYNFTTRYNEGKPKEQEISSLPDNGLISAVYFGTDVNDIGERITKLNEEAKNDKEEAKNDSGEPCINMMKYTRICDSAIMPCKSMISSIREFDSPIMPCKYIIDSIRQIDSARKSQKERHCVAVADAADKGHPPIITQPCPTFETNGDPPPITTACPPAAATASSFVADANNSATTTTGP